MTRMRSTGDALRRLDPAAVLAEAFAREPVFSAATVALVALIVPTLVAMALDARTLDGVSVWMKPLKFEIALAVYLATLSWYAGWLPSGMTAQGWYRAFAVSVVIAIAAEMVWVGAAAALGVKSHFNTSNPLLRSVYPIMGLVAIWLTAATLVYGVAILRDDAGPLQPAMRLAVGSGLVLTFASTVLIAGRLAAGTGQIVGGIDGGGRLPVLGWSLAGGDLRIAHFFATHALHAIPLAGYVAVRSLPGPAALWMTVIAVVGYTGLVIGLFIGALRGRLLF